MKVLGWIEPATWPAVVQTLAGRPDSDEITLVAVDASSAGQVPRVLGGLMGRGTPQDQSWSAMTHKEAERLLTRAAASLGRHCITRVLDGHPERAVTAAAERVDRLVMARDGDRSRLGPHSLGKEARFIIDHAPCTVELIWPEAPPSLSTIPPRPTHPRH